MDSRNTEAIKQILMEDDSDEDSQPTRRDNSEHELFGGLDMRGPEDDEEDLFKSVIINRKGANNEFKYTATEKYSPKVNRQKAKEDRYAASVMIKVNEVEEEKEAPTSNLKPGVTFVAEDRDRLGKQAIERLRKEKELGVSHNTMMNRDSLFQSFKAQADGGFDAKDVIRDLSMR